MSNNQIHLDESQHPPVQAASKLTLPVGITGVILGIVANGVIVLSFASGTSSPLGLILGTLISPVGTVVAVVSLTRQLRQKGPFVVALVGLVLSMLPLLALAIGAAL